MALGVLLPLGTMTAAAADIRPPAEAANLVVLIRFAGDQVGNADQPDTNLGYNKAYSSTIAGAPRTQWELLERRFNGTGDVFAYNSFKEYFTTVSDGAHTVTSVFPQTNKTDGTVAYLTMDGGVGEYTDPVGEQKLISEIAKKLNAAFPDLNGSTLDLNGDGIVDNLMILASVQKGGNYTPHTANAGLSAKIAGKSVGPYNILETTYTGAHLVDPFDIHTAAHEYIHIYGIPDYYRTPSKTGTPVGLWDPMGMPGGRPWPLAVTRERLGWTNIQQIDTKTASYELVNPAKAGGSARQAVKVYTPLSKNEYFVIEYRKQGNRYTANSMDWNIQGDGLIVYRVNDTWKEEGNLLGNDYIYVFRPDEIGLTDSAGTVSRAALGTASSQRHALGTADMGKTITDGAICYSDGRNSGIQIEVTAQKADAAVFTISFPDYSQMDFWETAVGTDGKLPSMEETTFGVKTAVEENSLYVLAEGLNSARVFRYDGTTWTDLGACAAQGGSTAITVWNGSVYVLTASYRGENNLKRYENGTWTTLASVSGFTANAPALGVAGGKLYVLLDRNSGKPQLYSLEGDQLQPYGPPLSVAYIVSPVIFDENGAPGVAYGSFRTNVSTRVSVCRNDVWEDILTNTVQSNANAVTKSGEKTYLLSTYTGQSPILWVWEAGKTPVKYSLEKIPANTSCGEIMADGAFLYVSVLQTGESEADVFYAPQNDPTDLTQLGKAVAKPASDSSAKRLGDQIYCAIAANSKLDVKRHEMPAQPVQQVTVTFDAQTNGGELADGSLKTQTGNAGTALALPTVKERAGFNFTGWWTEATGGTQITGPAMFPAADATYYAQWTEKTAVDVTFTSGEGVWNDGTTGEKKVPTKPDLKATIPGTVSRAGYTFDGWQSDNAAYPSLDAGATETAVIREGQAVHYTPKWSAKTYTIRFDKGSQQDATGTVNDQTYVYDTADAKLTTDVFTSTTHKMLGWSLDQNADAASYLAGAEFDAALKEAMTNSTDGTVTLYAVWMEKDAVSMTFNAGNGTFADNSKEKVERVKPGQQNNLPDAPTRPGYEFAGWMSENKADYPDDLTADATQTPPAVEGKNVTFTAKWNAITYTIHFDTQMEGVTGGPVADLTYKFDGTCDTMTLPTGENLRFAGHTFLGWGLVSGDQMTIFAPSSTIGDAIRNALLASATHEISLEMAWVTDSVTMHTIAASAGTNGTISPNGSVQVEEGKDQTFTITAASGYEIEKVLVDGVSVGAVSSYTFSAVTAEHTISVTFKKSADAPAPVDPKPMPSIPSKEPAKPSQNPDAGPTLPFTDVTEGAWYRDAVEYLYVNEIMNGVSQTSFGPEQNMTRGMITTMLHRVDGKPFVSGNHPFLDAQAGYFASAIRWAQQKGIVMGTSATQFSPNAPMTREQLAVALYRYAKYLGRNTGRAVNLSGFEDGNAVSSYARDAMAWAVAEGLLTGVGSSRLAPTAPATRAQVAVILYRFLRAG